MLKSGVMCRSDQQMSFYIKFIFLYKKKTLTMMKQILSSSRNSNIFVKTFKKPLNNFYS